MLKTLQATTLAAALAFAGTALADEKHEHPGANKAAPAKSAAKGAPKSALKAPKDDHDHENCEMMHGGMMGGGHTDPMARRMESLERRVDMMQLMLEQMLRRQDAAPPMPMK